jgi:hypothetical protein
MNMDLHIGTATSTDAASTQNGNVGHTFIENGHWTHWRNQMLALDSEKIDCFCLFWVLAASVDVAVPMCRSIFIRRWHVLLWFVGMDMLVVIVRYHFRHTFSSPKAEFMACYVNLAKFRHKFWWCFSINFAKCREFSSDSPFFEQVLMKFSRNFAA